MYNFQTMHLTRKRLGCHHYQVQAPKVRPKVSNPEFETAKDEIFTSPNIDNTTAKTPMVWHTNFSWSAESTPWNPHMLFVQLWHARWNMTTIPQSTPWKSHQRRFMADPKCIGSPLAIRTCVFMSTSLPAAPGPHSCGEGKAVECAQRSVYHRCRYDASRSHT
jgi:hypothetical protein